MESGRMTAKKPRKAKSTLKPADAEKSVGVELSEAQLGQIKGGAAKKAVGNVEYGDASSG
jgi:hypothetical protein